MFTYGKISILYLRSVRLTLEHEPTRLRVVCFSGAVSGLDDVRFYQNLVETVSQLSIIYFHANKHVTGAS
jgi:hypothetical protein